MKNAEYQGNLSCPQRNSAEHEGYAGAQSVGNQEVKERGGADLLKDTEQGQPEQSLQAGQSQQGSARN